jgi:demethylmenaquinone methyltransferase/2-methoxy-6-polyprenyl-1,4-benzoquinol methylase
MPLLDHFDFLAPYYDRFIRPPDHDNLIRAANLPADGLLLDAGGGTGRIASRLTGLVGKIILLDASTPMLRQAQTKGDLEPLAGATERIPFADASFERLIMVDAYHHLEHQADSLLECWRVLKPGGLMVVEEPDIDQFVVKLIALGEKLLLMRSRFSSGPRIAEALERLGGEVVIEREPPNIWIVAHKPADG